MARIPVDLARKPTATNAQDSFVSPNRGQGAIRAQAEGGEALLEGLNAVGRGTREIGKAILKREQDVDRMNLEAKSMEITRQFRQYLQKAQGDPEIKMLEENAVANLRAWITGEDKDTGERNVRSAGLRRDVTPRVKLFGETLSVLGDRRRVALQKARAQHSVENVRHELYKSVEWMPGRGLRTLVDLRDTMRKLGDFYRGQLGLSAEEANTWTISSVRELESQTASAGLSAIEEAKLEEDELKKRIKIFRREINDSDSFTELTTVERKEFRKRAEVRQESILKTREAERRKENAEFIKGMTAYIEGNHRKDPEDRVTKEQLTRAINAAEKEGRFNDHPLAEEDLRVLVDGQFAAEAEALRELDMEQVRGWVRTLEVGLANRDYTPRDVIHTLVEFKTKLTGTEWDKTAKTLFNKALGKVDRQTESLKRYADAYVNGLRGREMLGPAELDEEGQERYSELIDPDADVSIFPFWKGSYNSRMKKIAELMAPVYRTRDAYDSLQAEIYKFIDEANKVELEGGAADKRLDETKLKDIMYEMAEKALRSHALNEFERGQ